MAKRVLITGITGYLGGKLASHLAEQGFQVHGIVRQKNGDLPYVLHQTDGSTQSIVEVLRKAAPKTVFHLASLFKPSHVTADVQPLIQSNLLFGAQLLEAMVVSGVREFVNTGTLWQNFEGQAYNPVALYAATKQAFEDILKYFVETGGIRAITLKLTDTYGPGDTRRKILNMILKAASQTEPFQMTAGEQLIDLVHVADVVKAFEQAQKLLSEGGPNYRVRLVSSQSAVTIQKLVSEIEDALGKKIPIEWGKLPYRPREMFKAWNADPILEGWKAEVSLRDGIKSIGVL